MSDSEIPTLRVTPTDIDEMRRQLQNDFPQRNELVYAYGLSQEICLRLLGPDWWIRCLAGNSPSDDFLRPRPGNARESNEHQHRVIELGRLFTELCDVDGYEHMVRGLRTRTLLGAVTELRVAKLLRSGGYVVRFNDIETVVNGRSYDLEVDVGNHQRGTMIPLVPWPLAKNRPSMSGTRPISGILSAASVGRLGPRTYARSEASSTSIDCEAGELRLWVVYR